MSASEMPARGSRKRRPPPWPKAAAEGSGVVTAANPLSKHDQPPRTSVNWITGEIDRARSRGGLSSRRHGTPDESVKLRRRPLPRGDGRVGNWKKGCRSPRLSSASSKTFASSVPVCGTKRVSMGRRM